MKELLDEYKKSEESGWKYQPKMRKVYGLDLKVGDVVTEDYDLCSLSCILKLEKIDKEDDTYYFSKIFGIGYGKNEDDLFPFSGNNYWHVLYE